MIRRLLAMALLLAGVPAVAAESLPRPVAQTAKESIPGPKPANAATRKDAQRKASDVQKNSSSAPKQSLPLLDEKNLGLGCAQG